MARKIGRPKKDKTTDETIFVGLRMPKTIAVELSKDAVSNFRMRGQHILWILSDYIKGVHKSGDIELLEKRNKHIYSEREMNDMYEQSKKGDK